MSLLVWRSELNISTGSSNDDTLAEQPWRLDIDIVNRPDTRYKH